MEVASANLLSSLNNKEAFHIDNHIFSRYFGFIEEDFREFVKDELTKDEIEEALNFYNGYRINSLKKLNIYSTMKYLSLRHKIGFKSYWK